MNNDQEKEAENEIFDKKEFSLCRKMLGLKKFNYELD